MTTSKTTLIGVFVLIAAATIAGAWGFELIGRYEPCALCLQQRIPYYAALPLGAIALLLAWRGSSRHAVTGIMISCAVIMAAGSGLGLYHAGVEWGWWEGPSGCAATGLVNSTDGVLPDLTRRVVPCTEAALRIGGISLAGYNAAISLLAAVIAYRAARAKT